MTDGGGFLEELRARGVVRAALLYAATAFAVIEFADIAFPRMGLPDSAVNAVLWIGIGGLPVALLVAWLFDIRAERDSGREKAWLAPSTLAILVVLITSGVGMSLLWDHREAAPEPTSQPASAESTARPELERSVAVLPFENISGDEKTEPFTVGIHDDLVNNISRIHSIKTISRRSVLQYLDTTKTIPQIARELGVATVLEGGVQRAGDRVRINVQLIDAASDVHLWSSTYDRQLSAANIFAIQSEIASSVAEALRVTLTGDERRRIASAPTQNLVAVETYFLGKQLLEKRTPKSLFAAVEYFEQVIQLDPEFALGYSGLSDAHMLIPEYVPDADSQLAREQSEAAASRALVLDPDLPEALSSMGWNRLIHYYDWEGAEALLRRALDVQSNNTNALHWLSHVLSWQGQHEEAIVLARRVVELDPNSPVMGRHLSYVLADAGDFDASIEVAVESMARFQNQSEQQGDLWLTHLRAGRTAGGAEYLERWAAQTGRDVDAAREVGAAFVLHRQTGEMQTLPGGLIERVDFGSPDLGQVYAFLGDAEGTLSALEQAADERSGSRSVLSMRVNPGYDFIRATPRFQAVLTRIGLAD